MKIPRNMKINDLTEAVFGQAVQQNRVMKNKSMQMVISIKMTKKSPLWCQLLGENDQFRVGRRKVFLKRRLLLLRDGEDDDDNDEKDEKIGTLSCILPKIPCCK